MVQIYFAVKSASSACRLSTVLNCPAALPVECYLSVTPDCFVLVYQ